MTYQDPVDTAQQNLPELSSIRLNKKMFNNRLKNNPEDLKKLVRGAKEDIQTISKLVKTMSTYRSQFGDVRGILQNQKSNLGTSAASKD